MSSKIKAILWDIGGVLLRDPYIGEFWQNKEESKILRSLFGTGKISPEEFIKRASKLLNISEKEFLDNYEKAYFPIEKEEAYELFKKTKGKNYILSDTNPIYLQFIRKKHEDLFNLVNKQFMSSEIGYRKKEKELFEKVIKILNKEPEKILFIDNKKELLEVAETFGIKTILFENKEQLEKELKEYDLLD